MNSNYNLISYDRIPSTQTAAARMIDTGEANDRTVIMAASQSAGRGRGANRRWVSRRGSLYASFIYRADGRHPTLSYSFAVAAAETLIGLGVPARIKWPNDLMADGRKIGGMLLEYCRDFLIVGIGINIKTCPAVDYPTAKTDDYAKGLTPGKVVGELIQNFEKWRKKDFADVRARWMELAPEPGSLVRYRARAATYCGLNGDGAMVLRVGGRYQLAYSD